MNEEIKSVILALMDTCIEATEYSKAQCLKSQFVQSQNILNELAEVAENIRTTLELHNEKEIYTTSILYCKNIQYSIDKILKEGLDEKSALKIIGMELIPFCYELKKITGFYLDIFPYKSKWKKYRDERNKQFKEYVKKIEREEHTYKYKVSIVVTSYNKLEYTKAAIESIYKYTDFERLNVELITVNNGSSDGTEAYFESLPHTKKVNLRYNILGNNTSAYLVEGKYGVGFSNDVLATEGWLEKLIACMESDKYIHWAVPTCNSDAISNNQGVDVPYKNSLTEIEQIQEFAKQYNDRHEGEWEERALLMPFVAISRASGIDFIDHLYPQVEFVDDDLSTSLRRVGLKQMLIKDAFMHHFGSITLREAQVHSNSLNNMREVYYKKWGVDAWDSKGDFNQVEALLNLELIGQNPTMLCIEPRFGGNHLRVKNHLRNNGILSQKATGVVIDARYIEDARYMYDEVLVRQSVEEFLENEKRKFNLIYFGTFLNHLVPQNLIAVLEKVYQLLDDKGQIIFAFKNHHSAKTAVELLTMGGLGEYSVTEFSGYNASMLFYQMTDHELFHTFKIKRIGNYGGYVDSFAALSQTILGCTEKMKNDIRDQLATEYYVVAINKE